MSQKKSSTGKAAPSPGVLSTLELTVMEVLWKRRKATADEVRKALGPKKRLSDSSIRTILRRLEAKRHVAHERDGKRFVFRAILHRPTAAAAAARRIVDTICGGAIQALLLGLLESEMVTREELDELRERVDRAEDQERG